MTEVNQIPTPQATEIAAIEGRKQGELLDISAILRALRRNLWMLLVPAIVFSVLGFIYVRQVATPIYRASAQVVLQTSDAQIVNLQSVSGSLDQFDPQTIATELSVITSEQVLSNVVTQMGLLEDPEFNPYLDIDMTELSPEERVIIGERILPDTIAMLRDALEVRQLPGTYLFALAAYSADPVKTRDLANALTDAYLEQQVLRKVEATQQATEWLTQRAQELQAQLLDAEAGIENFRFNDAEGIEFAESIELERLTREAQAIRELYQHFLTRLKETAAQQGLHRADARVLSYAVTPLEPSSPRTRFVLLIAALAGLFFGLAAVILREVFLKPGLRSVDALQAISAHPVLGMVPMLPPPQQRRLTATLSERSNEALARAIEHIRLALLLRPPPRRSTGGASLAFASSYRSKESDREVPTRDKARSATIFGITSSTKDEGKTTTAVALAHSLAAAGSRVLLIDADLRQRNLSQLLAPGAQAGIVAAVLPEEDAREEPSLLTTDLGFDFLPAEVLVERPVDFFQTERFKTLIQAARPSYDYVLLDTPPILVVPDARALTTVIDQMIVAFRYGKTTQAMAVASLAALDASRVTVSGMVMTKVPAKVFRESNHGLGVLAY
ncbi:MAG: AAA family ATPase [Pseudomonadota bacterium]